MAILERWKGYDLPRATPNGVPLLIAAVISVAMESEQVKFDDDLQRRILKSTLDEVAARDEDKADCCVICLDVVTEQCEALPCGHRNFDYMCVSNWLFETPQCPLCKAKVVKVVHGPKDAQITTFFDQKSTPAASADNTTRLPETSFGATNYARRARATCPRSRYRRIEERNRSAPISDVIAIRRDVYRRQQFSKHVGSNRLSRYRELTPHMFCTDAELVSRARMWTRRELRVFSFLSPCDNDDNSTTHRSNLTTSGSAVQQRRRANNAEFLLEYIIAILKSVDIMGSGGQAEDMLTEFLGRESTKLFLHELRAWLRSPFSKLEDWDRAVQYENMSEGRSSRAGEMSSGRFSGEGRSRSRSNRRHRDGTGQKGDFYRPRRGQHISRNDCR